MLEIMSVMPLSLLFRVPRSPIQIRFNKRAWNEIPNEKKRAPRRIWRCTRQPKTFDHPGAGSPTKQKTKGCKANKMAGLCRSYLHLFSPCSDSILLTLFLDQLSIENLWKRKHINCTQPTAQAKETQKTTKRSTNPSYFLALGYGNSHSDYSFMKWSPVQTSKLCCCRSSNSFVEKNNKIHEHSINSTKKANSRCQTSRESS